MLNHRTVDPDVPRMKVCIPVYPSMTEDRQIALFEKFKQTVASSQKHVFAPTEILFLITQLRAEHPFPRSLSERKFQRSLIDSGVLKEISLTASYSFETTRYHVGICTRAGVPGKLPRTRCDLNL